MTAFVCLFLFHSLFAAMAISQATIVVQSYRSVSIFLHLILLMPATDSRIIELDGRLQYLGTLSCRGDTAATTLGGGGY